MTSPALHTLAKHAYNGASNPLALIYALPAAIQGMTQDEVRSPIEVKVIVGQLSYLLGESLGPSSEVIWQYAASQV